MARALVASPFYCEARRLVVYAPLPGEIPLDPLLAHVAADGRALLWPRQRADGGLEFVPCADPEALGVGPHGVREPAPTAAATPLGADDLVLVPGLAFDAVGRRLGRGGGAWDRALAAYPQARSVGIGYEFQVVDRVPCEAHDRSLAALCTECGFRRSQAP